MAATGGTVDAALEELISTFNELNSATVEEFDSEPSPLEFMRFASRNAPFVIRGGASSWKACRKWDAAYLKAALAGEFVNVAVTPHGNADSPTFSPAHQRLVLAKPHEESQSFDKFLDYVIDQETDPAFPLDAETRYAQTQNDNFRDEYLTLFPDAQKDIPFARIALQKAPDAINLWIGNSKSVTATHKDNFENIFVQVRGRKHFVLLPPLCQPCMNEKLLPPATYVRRPQSGGFSLEVDEGKEPVPFVTWDPEDLSSNATSLSRLANPMHVTLEPGDMLYLPAMWYHKVSQSCIPGDEGFVVAINYWYDMEFSGTLYPLASFLRNLGRACDK
ncbi:phospholipase A2 protein family [Purpureocillium lilacinum]|uniref:Phospholipase A2 protein family n=2 Tax=Purpureocillium lilacinum TaxID=33203 RepID=A0A179GIG8_PURLI|nr:phospholipase A2 protein family [Purpureocillium lilacinum]